MEEFVFLDDIATADAAIEARGDTLEELFRESAMEYFVVLLDTNDVQPKVKKEIHLYIGHSQAKSSGLARLILQLQDEPRAASLSRPGVGWCKGLVLDHSSTD